MLLILAVLPSLILLYFILFMDRHEREPLGLVVKIILLGALSTVPAAAAPAPAAAAVPVKNQLWKAIVSRSLLGLSGLFWGFVIWGIAAFPQDFEVDVHQVILGAVILSFLPILIGVLLELSYRRARKISGSAELPGRGWKMIAARERGG